MSAAKTRLRKVACPDCGYTVRMARSWMDRGFPVCPCGGSMAPVSPADLAYCGIIGPDDMKSSDWTAICYENGWEDLIVRKGSAAKSWSARRAKLQGNPAEFCVHPSCGLWVAAGAEHCSAGHAQSEDAAPLEAEAMPF